MYNPPSCPVCNTYAMLVGGEEIYPHRPDLHHKKFWACLMHDAYVGCHPDSTRPLGRLADAATRRLKVNAHAAFDPIWKSKELTRSRAYHWLADQLGIPPQECHMGSLSDDHLRRVVVVCKEYKA